ncbi:hypothetical protein [Streptomyces sp. NPDC003247]|uniref:hypothetical protein n=1 Tax=Streptomyces sp. NPDC003247 TaxID=3364677 RepID=UPI00369F3825
MQGIAETLSMLGVEALRVDRYHGDWVTGRMKHEVDFLCAVLGPGDQEFPPVVYLDIGVALGRKIPVLLIMPPGVRTPLAISGLPRVDVSLDNLEALQLHLENFVASMRTPQAEPQELGGRSLDDSQYADLKHELERIASGFEGVDYIRQPYKELEDYVRKVFETAGAVTSTPARRDSGYDFAIWVDGASEVIGGPTIVSVKFMRQPRKSASIHAREFSSYLHYNPSPFGLLIYALPSGVEGPRYENPGLPVSMLSVAELLESLHEGSLATLILRMRNALAHGGVRRDGI